MNRRLFQTFVTLSIIFVFSQFYRTSLAVISPILMSQLGIGAEKLGTLGSAFFYSFAILQVPMGMLLDRCGPRLIMTLFSAIGGLGTVLFASASDYTLLLLGRLLQGIGMSSALMGSFKVFVLSFPSSKFATFSGILLSIGTLGNILASSPLAYLASKVGWRLSFLFFGIVTFFISFLLWVVLGKSDENRAREKTADVNLKKILFRIVKNISFWQISALAFFRYGTFVAMQGLWFGPYLVHVKHFSPVMAGNILMMLAFGLIVGSSTGGYLCDTFFKSPKKVVVLGVSLYSLFILFFVGLLDVSNSLYLSIIFFLLGTFNSFGILIYTHVGLLFPPKVSATVMSSVNFFTMSGGAFFMQVMGKVIGLFELKDGVYPPYAYHTAFFLCFLGITLSLAFYSFSKEEKYQGD